MSSAGPIRRRWDAIAGRLESADVGFLLLRLVALGGAFGWLALEGPTYGPRAGIFYRTLAYFLAYGVFLYVLLLLRFDRKKEIYRLSLFLDLSFVYLLCSNSGGYQSSFTVGFYLLTALHAFYYGPAYGIVVGAACTAVYFLAGVDDPAPDWVDFVLRSSFLFLLGVSIGLLSGELRKDRARIVSLNNELLRTIEEMKGLQEKLIRAEKLSALGRLTSDVAHEIRNPLTAIGGFAKRLERVLPPRTTEKEHAAIIVQEVTRLERILKDILTFSREPRARSLHADLNGFLLETEKALKDLCRGKGVNLVIDPERDPPRCLIDLDQVRQAVVNLVNNALDAMTHGGTLVLRTRKVVENGVHYAALDVVDTGAGIPADKVDRIFEPFYTTKEIGQGTGLGLSICKKIVEEHRGLIRVTSLVGEGSTFSLRFPYMPEGESFKPQCWEVMGCGMEKAPPDARCPSYPNFGRICWAVAGTFCEGKVAGKMARKIGDCRRCRFYLAIARGVELPAGGPLPMV